MENFQDDPQGAEDDELSLRDRMPDYAAVFGIGLLASSALGVVFWMLTDSSLAASVGYTVILYGVVLLLAGGASGGGYTNIGIGAVGAMFGTRRTDEDQSDADRGRGAESRMDSRERLRRGLRPEANPRAFWQVMAGVLYVGLGLLVVIWWS